MNYTKDNKRIVVINGHPSEDSFCEGIAKAYIDSAKENGASVKFINIRKLDFDPILRKDRNAKQVLEKDLKKAQEDIKWADHLVFIHPVWWGGSPALMKGFLDRAFTPGFAYDPKNKTLGLPRGLLSSKSAEIILTMGAPSFVYKLYMGKPATKSLKYSLNYCGIRNIKYTYFGRVDAIGQEKRQEILVKIKSIASKRAIA